MMHRANVPLKIRYYIWREAVATATKLDGLTVVKNSEGVKKTRYEHIFGKNPNFVKSMRTWGEAGTVKTKNFGTPKIADRGVHCMFVGYTVNMPTMCTECGIQ